MGRIPAGLGGPSHLEEKTLELTHGRLVSSQDAVIADEASYARPHIGYRCEEDEGVRNGPKPLEEGKGDEDETDTNQAERSASSLDVLDDVAFCAGQIHIAAGARLDGEKVFHGERGEVRTAARDRNKDILIGWCDGMQSNHPWNQLREAGSTWLPEGKEARSGCCGAATLGTGWLRRGCGCAGVSVVGAVAVAELWIGP